MRRRLRRAGEWLGLIDPRPKPTYRQVLRALLYALPVLVLAAAVSTLVERGGAPEWVSLLIMVLPISFMSALLQRRRGDGS